MIIPTKSLMFICFLYLGDVNSLWFLNRSKNERGVDLLLVAVVRDMMKSLTPCYTIKKQNVSLAKQNVHVTPKGTQPALLAIHK